MPRFGWGTWQIVNTHNPAVCAYSYRWRHGLVMAVHNLSDEPHTVTLDLSDYNAAHLIDLLSDCQYKPIDEKAHRLELEGYGFRWFRLGGRQD